MRTSRRRAAAAVHGAAAAILAAGGLLAAQGAGAAAADGSPPAFAKVALSPSYGVVLPTVASPPAVLTLRARVTDATGADQVFFGLYDPAGLRPDGRTVPAALTTGTVQEGTWTATVSLPRDSPVGIWSVRAFATDLAANMSEPDVVYATLPVRHKTRFIGFDVRPEPTTSGDPLTFAGKLQRYKPGTGWVAYGGKKVYVYFKKEGGTAFVKVATRTTDASGAFGEGPPKSQGPGAWRMSWVGNDQRAPATSHADTILAPPPA